MVEYYDTLEEKKLPAKETVMISIISKRTKHTLTFVARLFNLRIEEDSVRVKAVLPFIFFNQGKYVIDQWAVCITYTDDPYLCDAFGPGSLTHSYRRFRFADAVICQQLGETIISCNREDYYQQASTPER